MRRKYSSQEFIDITNMINENIPLASITTDIIVGFPSETEVEFIETLKVVKRSYLNNLHVFPYSSRPGTSAYYSKEHTKPEIINQRSKELVELSKKISDESMKKIIGEERSVLWEGKDKSSGLTEDYYRVIRRVSDKPNDEITKQKIKGLEKDNLYI
jgi:tRNA A37 methylthiotransferase MiaB